MMYLIAILLPPLAVLLCGKPIQCILNFFLTLCFYFPGAIHALLVVSSSHADKRTEKIVRATREAAGVKQVMVESGSVLGGKIPLAMIECPHCKAEIRSDAAKCRFCGEWVTPQTMPGAELGPSA